MIIRPDGLEESSKSRRRAIHDLAVVGLLALGGCGREVGDKGRMRGPSLESSGHGPMPQRSLTLDDLRAADIEAAQRFPRPFDQGLGSLGLILDKNLDQSRYRCTPLNCKTFASTGGEGVHFSILPLGNRPDGQVPVVMTNPGGGNGRSWIVGENLMDFLCLGYHRGYFALEQLAYQPEFTIKAYVDPDLVSDDPKSDGSCGFRASVGERQILEFLIRKFELRPWTQVDRFQSLQEKYKPSLNLPKGYE